MNIADVNDYVVGALESESLQLTQMKCAGPIISQFLLVRQGLNGRVDDEQLDQVAATLTAAIWMSNK